MTPSISKTWAPAGTTPIIRVHAPTWTSMQCISGLTSGGRLYFRTRTEDNFDARGVRDFLKVLLQNIDGRVVVILDNAPTHRSKLVREFVDSVKRLELVFLPPYSPEFNPDEHVWGHVKCHQLKNQIVSEWDEMVARVRQAMKRLQNLPNLLRSFLKASELPW